MSFNPYEMAAKRINAGEAVAEGFLYGIEAATLIKAHGITETQLNRYRKEAYEGRKKILGADMAEEWRASRREWHKVMLRDYYELQEQRRRRDAGEDK